MTINFKELAVEWHQLYGVGISRELLHWLYKVEAYRYDLGVSTMSYTDRGVCNFRMRMSVPEILCHMFDVIDNPNHRDVTDLSKEEFNRVMNLMGYRRGGERYHIYRPKWQRELLKQMGLLRAKNKRDDN